MKEFKLDNEREASTLLDSAIDLNSIKVLANKLYTNITERGIDGIKDLFYREDILSKELRFDKSEEYLKRMIMAQMNIDKMLLIHKYRDRGFEERTVFNKESNKLREQIDADGVLNFDDNTLDALFGNSLGIKSEKEYEEWREFAYNDRHGDKKFDSIYLEEEFKFKHENESNSIKKFIQSFRYRKMLKENVLEDSYVKKVREMITKEIISNPEDTFVAYRKVHNALEKGVEEYENIKDVEDITRMTLMSLRVKKDEPINIETVCNTVRNEMKNTIGSTKIGTEYRQKQVTLGSKTGISTRPVVHTIPFKKVPDAIKNLQTEYEKAYNEEENHEEYIKRIAKIYADFIYVQPYEDGNKRTATCLLNSMLLSKGIIPPPISLVNDEQMVEAFYKAENKDYTMMQDIIFERYKTMQLNNGNNKGRDKEEAIIDDRDIEK